MIDKQQARMTAAQYRKTAATRKRKGMGPEDHLQARVVDYLELQQSAGTFRFFAVPNGGHITEGLGKKRKRLGARAGVPNIIIEVRGGRVIEIELKTDTGRLSKNQQERLRQSCEMEIPHHICRSVEDVLDVLRMAQPI